jgi:hypothetical protein
LRSGNHNLRLKRITADHDNDSGNPKHPLQNFEFCRPSPANPESTSKQRNPSRLAHVKNADDRWEYRKRHPPITGIPQATITEFRLGGEKPITGAFGGSLDYRISDRFYYRIQPELIVVHLGGTNDMNLRLSTGIAFTFGRL